MRDTDVRAAIAAERRDLAALLGELPAERWDAPSLCAGWRVREVVAHMTMPFRSSLPGFLWQLVRARGNFDRMADRSARRDAALLPAEELLGSLRENATHPWKPPGGGFEGALSHDVIHGLDITVALGLARKVPEDRLGIVLRGVRPKQVKYFGVDLDGIELRADDLDWSYGSGAPLSGAAQDLLLVLCGRSLPEGRLRGGPSARFSAR
ncbi:maleylpyruvate isomerase family mycothiol-dependent enzyme [Actinomadura sp. HBU206391]|uniref:maleylpyruvate isomerase family mycothiol-dependent enzyme n=1 Tax=Actinomadura sp. HBU206391 TaxID=2731692 RepID=UPI0016507A20|nr:maleylpyruvate isomerase family mycothiol-dependent enzyme [Actinomadura sp. HBU206391]MBC6457598.1 maleylpyruvate isomerase family mycothiol-dependent enzyme [Actinomadura sp. HBU206391]